MSGLGTTLGPYRIERELGSGGMGRVFAATVVGEPSGIAVGTRVALKVIHAHLLESPGALERFRREGEIGRTVRHENVVRTHECGTATADGAVHHYLVMEMVEGQTLRDLLRDLGHVPEGLCRHVGREVAKGLSAIHAAGVIHRDVKPENVLVTADHVVKIMDLGVARVVQEAMRLSQSGAFVGSIHYASPEQFAKRGPAPDGRADLHALGVVLYELVSGVNPYDADDVPQVIERVLHAVPRRLGDVHPQTSPFFEEVVHCLLAKKREQRFADAATLASVLAEGEESAWWKERSRALRTESRRPLRRVAVPRETAVYAREAEIETLRSLYERAKSGAGAVVLVEGEPGIGKSRLVDEVIGRLQQQGEDLNFLFGRFPPSGTATASGAFTAAFREQFGEEGSAAYLPQTPLLVPAFDAFLAGSPAPPGVEPLTRDSLQTCFVQATRALAAERVTVVLIDDLDFAPDEGRALFTSLAMAVPGHRVLLVGTTGPGVSETWLAGVTRLAQTSRMTLGRLGAKELIRLLEDAFRSRALATSLGAEIALKSDGNPFFVFEILRGLREGRFIARRDDGTWVSTRMIEDIRIPSSVLDLVNARVAELDDDERNLLDVASCWGFEFEPALVGSVLGLGPIAALQRFGRIEKRHRLVRSAGRQYVFDHHQVQDALYGALHETLREHYHAGLAAALEVRTNAAERAVEALDGALAVSLCEHFLKGGRGAQALRYLGPALSHLEARYRAAPTVALAERALAVEGLLTGAERARVLLRIGDVSGPLDRMGRRERQRAACEEAVRLAEAAGEREVAAWAERALGNCHRLMSHHAEAESALDRSLAYARATGNAKLEVATLLNLGVVSRVRGRLAEARECYERALAVSRACGDVAGEASVTGNLGNVLRSEGRLAEARAHFERSLALSREIGNRRSEASALGNLGILLHAQGRLAEAAAHFEQHLAASREIGSREGEAIATGNLGNVLLSQGRLSEAFEHFERTLALSREIGDRNGEALAEVNLGDALHAQGRVAESRDHIDRAVSIGAAIGGRQAEAAARSNLGRFLAHQGRSVEAREQFERSLALRRAASDRLGEATACVALGAHLITAGDPGAARETLETARRLADESGFVVQGVLARCHLARLPGGDVVSAIAAFTEYADHLGSDERREARYLLWKATGDVAHLVAAKRILDEAVAHDGDDIRTSMLTNLPQNREIVEAAARLGT